MLTTEVANLRHSVGCPSHTAAEEEEREPGKVLVLKMKIRLRLNSLPPNDNRSEGGKEASNSPKPLQMASSSLLIWQSQQARWC